MYYYILRLLFTIVHPFVLSYLGCVTDTAFSCVQSMRLNASGNVAPQCHINRIGQKYESSQCCPVISLDITGRPNLMYLGSGKLVYLTTLYPFLINDSLPYTCHIYYIIILAYPETLRCIQAAGIYSYTITLLMYALLRSSNSSYYTHIIP